MRPRLFARPRQMALTIATAVLLLLVVLVLPRAAGAQRRGFYHQRNLVSDLPGLARFTDANLVNTWGLSHTPTSP